MSLIKLFGPIFSQNFSFTIGFLLNIVEDGPFQVQSRLSSYKDHTRATEGIGS